MKYEIMQIVMNKMCVYIPVHTIYDKTIRHILKLISTTVFTWKERERICRLSVLRIEWIHLVIHRCATCATIILV